MRHGQFIKLLENEPHKMNRSDGRWGVRVELFSALGNGRMQSTVPFWRKREAMDYIKAGWILQKEVIPCQNEKG